MVVYRTVAPPHAGLENETRDEATLATFGLPPDLRLAYPTQQLSDGRTGMREVPCPVGWDRVYFTPVTLLEGKARVGRSVAQAVIPMPEEPVVVERADHQLLKFGWPGNAQSVAVSIAPAGMPATTPVESHFEISRDSYRKLGGLQFPRRLPYGGCSVHLAGVAFVNLQRVYGEPVVTEYPGLLRIYYQVEVKRSLMHNPDRALIMLAAERELNGAGCPPFVLVHRPDRLPLHARDGEPLPVAIDDDEAPPGLLQFRPARLRSQFGDPVYRANVRGHHGFIRLFADIPADVLRQVALLDPPVQNLVLKA